MTKLDELIDASGDFLAEIQNLTPGQDLEQWLNTHHGLGTPHYDKISALIRQGVEEGWAATDEVFGRYYRRQLLASPSERTHFFSITVVYMDSRAGEDIPVESLSRDLVIQGQYHSHPYGEINMVIPIDEGAELAGLNGWQGPGWTSPDPGTRHYPEARNGAVIALFYLPAGRVVYKFDPSEVPPRREDARLPV